MATTIYSQITGKLTGHFAKGEAQAIARILIEDLLHLPLSHVMAGLNRPLSAQEGQTLDTAISRLLAGEPIQHIIGKTIFCDNQIIVNPSVLIPRPETEQLVSLALSLPIADEEAQVMDACTGSGCIAIALKKKRPQWHVHACDISAAALHTAKENAALNEANIIFSQADITSTQRPKGPYSLIASNPPYVMNKERPLMQAHVLEHEPHLALFVPDDDPLIFYRAIAQWGRQSLIPSGWITAEINPLICRETLAVFEAAGYSHCATRPDMFDKQRFIICQR